MTRHFSRRGFLCGGASTGILLAAGCDLIDLAKNPVIHFTLPPRSYELKTDDPNWKTPPAFFNTAAISCETAAGCCPPPGTPAGLIPQSECDKVPIICQSKLCGIGFPLETYNPVNLGKEAPALSSANGVVSEITLESLTFKITNSVGADFPPVRLYIAPEATKTAKGQGALLIGETPMAPKDVVTSKTLETSAEVRAAFAMYARNVNTPFNFIAATDVAILSGQPLPNGKVVVEVTGTVSAKL
jgi:hypothetical protein